MKIKGTVALVTGGATGIGRATAEALAGAGARGIVVNYAHAREEAEDAVRTIERLGVEAKAICADVRDQDAVNRLIAETVGNLGRLDILVNCAGTTRFVDQRDLDALTDEVWHDIVETNLMGPFRVTRAASSALRDARGAVLNVASIAGHRAHGSSIPYAVSKAGLLQLTRSLAVALAPEVRVNAVSPGHVDTPWHRQRLGEDGAKVLAEEMAAREPAQKVASPADVAAVILDMLTMDMVTGQTLIIDGGRHLLY